MSSKAKKQELAGEAEVIETAKDNVVLSEEKTTDNAANVAVASVAKEQGEKAGKDGKDGKNAASGKKAKIKKEKKPNRLATKLKETGSELKKVSWPPFKKVVKQTGIVISVVVLFTALLFGIDKLLELIFKALV